MPANRTVLLLAVTTVVMIAMRLPVVLSVQVQVTTLAGSGAAAFADGTGTSASFDSPSGVAVDSAGNVYVTDMMNNRIRKVTAAGVVTTLAGNGSAASGEGTGTSVAFRGPFGVAVDSAGNVYVADMNNHRICKVTADGVVTTLAGTGLQGYAEGTGTNAAFNYPTDVAVDGAGNVYIADSQNCRISQAECGRRGHDVGRKQLALYSHFRRIRRWHGHECSFLLPRKHRP